MKGLLAIGLALVAWTAGMVVGEAVLVAVNWLFGQLTPTMPPDWALLGPAYAAFALTTATAFALGWKGVRALSR